MKQFYKLGILLLFALQPFHALLAAEGDEISVIYNGSTAQITIPDGIKDVVSATVTGADVVITSSTVSEEYIYTVSGSTSNGSLLINGSYKLTLKLAGTDIHSDKGAAIDVECGKRIAVILENGTINSLSDCTGGAQKAALYFSGHPEFQGSGTLNVTGYSKHAISAKEYLQLKKSIGTINILGAVSDGIHCGRGRVNNENNFFQINGGAVNISNVGGDCIDSDDFGSMLIKGGTLNLTVGDGGRGLKCDSVLTMVDGKLNITVPGNDAEGIRTCYSADFQGGCITIDVSGNGSKGIKAKNDNETVMDGGCAMFNGADVEITASGSDFLDVSTGETSKCMCISVDKDLTQTAGNIALMLEGESAKAYNVKGRLTRTGGTFTATRNNYYNVNPYDFQYDMAAYVLVSLNGRLIEDYGTYQLAAFCNNTCCGVANVQKVGQNTYAYLRIYSNEPESDISFSLLNVVTGKEYASDQTIAFQSDGTLGTPSSPYVINITNNITIADGTELNFSQARTYDKFIYTRNFGTTNWQSLYLPVAVPVSKLEEQGLKVAYINNFNQYDTDGDDVPDELKMEVFYIRSGILLPNYPYMVRAVTTGAKEIVVENAEVLPADEETITCSSMTYTYDVTGTYHKVPARDLYQTGSYIVSAGTLKQLSASSTATLGAERWFLTITPRAGAYTPLPNEIKIHVMDEVEDGISPVSQSLLRGEEEFYNLNGQRVSKAQKGIYIRNGRKVYIK